MAFHVRVPNVPRPTTANAPPRSVAALSSKHTCWPPSVTKPVKVAVAIALSAATTAPALTGMVPLTATPPPLPAALPTTEQLLHANADVPVTATPPPKEAAALSANVAPCSVTLAPNCNGAHRDAARIRE